MAIKCDDTDEKTGYKGYFNTDNVFLFVPNIIDYIRVAFLAYFVYNASIGNYNVACICYVVSVSLDELDGNSARYFNQTSLFGMIIDILIDEATVSCLCMVLCTLYPNYIIILQLYTVIDVAAQWTNYQYAAMYRNNNYTRADDWLLNIYFNKKIFTNLWVYGNHVFLLMLYLCSYTSLPEIQVFGSTICIWKAIALMSAPWSVTRLCIMMYLLLTSLSNIAHHDVLIRRKNRQETEKARQSEYEVDNAEKTSNFSKSCVHLELGKELEGFEQSENIDDRPLICNEEFVSRIISASNKAMGEEGSVCTNCRNELFSQLFLPKRTKNRSIHYQHYCCYQRQHNNCYSRKLSTLS